MPPELILGLFNVFAPIVRDIIAKIRAGNGDKMPTDAEILAEFTSNIDRYLQEGAAWRAAHPKHV